MKKPKVLFFDIETSPILAYIWRTGSKINISHDQIKKGQKTEILCVCWKFLGDRTVSKLSWNMKTRDSSQLVKEFTKVVESADVVIAHNGDSFDIKHLNAQRLMNNQDPINWPTSEDTLKNFRKVFNLPSHRLDYISKILLGAGKAPMNFDDWVQIVENRSKTHMDKMVRYCQRDVRLLERVFKKASKFFPVKAHRGVIAKADRDACPHCASDHVVIRGYNIKKVGKYQALQCRDCSHYFQGRKV